MLSEDLNCCPTGEAYIMKIRCIKCGTLNDEKLNICINCGFCMGCGESQ